MDSLLMFVLAAIAAVLIAMVWVFRGYTFAEFKEYFGSHTGRGILKGIVLAVGAAALIAALSLLGGCQHGTYFNWVSVYGGLEATKGKSPSCEEDYADERVTSNLGARGNIYLSPDRRYAANAKYTHHSCAFSPDDLNYDAFGLEIEYFLWQRK